MKQNPCGCRCNKTGSGTLLIALLLLTAGLLIPAVSANPPSDMTLAYDGPSKLLQVTITHPVPNPQQHYIKEVTIAVNGKVVNSSPYSGQPAMDSFTYGYPLDIVPGDDVRVTASCSLAGSLSRSLPGTVTGRTPSSSLPEKQPTQKSPAGLIAPLAGAAALLLPGRTKK